MRKNRMGNPISNQNHEPFDPEQAMSGTPTVGGRVLLILVTLVAIPFAWVILANFTSITGIQIWDRHRNHPLTPAAVKPQVGEMATDAHFNELDLSEQLRRLHEEGRVVFFEGHSWQIPGYKPTADLNKLIEVTLSSGITAMWNAKATPGNMEEAEEAAEYYKPYTKVLFACSVGSRAISKRARCFCWRATGRCKARLSI